MSLLLWLDHARLNRIRHLFQKPRGVARSDDRNLLNCIIHVVRNGLRWLDALAEHARNKTLYNRFIRWSRAGVFDRIFTELAAMSGATDTVMIDATHLKAHRTAASLHKKGAFPGVSGAPRAA